MNALGVVLSAKLKAKEEERQEKEYGVHVHVEFIRNTVASYDPNPNGCKVVLERQYCERSHYRLFMLLT